ncbi:MAG: nuclear transport factor 2 family protein [Acidobacteriota bacterium]
MFDEAKESVRVQRVERAIFTAIQDRDEAVLMKHLDASFVHIDAIGTRQDREAFVLSITGSPLEIMDVSAAPLTVAFTGDVAIAAGIQRALVRLEDDRRIEARTAFTDIFVQKDGEWLLTLAHSLDLGADGLSTSEGFDEMPS